MEERLVGVVEPDSVAVLISTKTLIGPVQGIPLHLSLVPQSGMYATASSCTLLNVTLSM